MKYSKLKKWAVLLVVGLGAFGWFTASDKADNNQSEEDSSIISINDAKIVYSKHAKERMKCREITEDEIKTVLEQGKINYQKSSKSNDICKTRWAYEGTGDNAQQIRIIVAQCEKILTVITVIDTKQQWNCVD